MLSMYCTEMEVSMRTEEIEMASDGDINVASNTEVTSMQTGDQVQGTVLPVESVVDNNADAIGQQDHGGAVQEETCSAVKVVTIMSSHVHACVSS